MRRVSMLSYALLIIVAIYGTPIFAAEQNSCPPGTRPATAEDTVVKNGGHGGAIQVGTCYNPNDKDVGSGAENAKKQLASMWCNNRPASCGPYTGSMEQLDPKFAQCALKFIQAVRGRDSSICITSAYRSTGHQACVCSKTSGPCAAPGRSKHQQGLAIDLIKPGLTVLPSWIHDMARGNTGVEFPIRNDSGHMQPVSGDQNCSSPGFAPQGGDVGGAQTPSSGFSQSLRDYLGGGSSGGGGGQPQGGGGMGGGDFGGGGFGGGGGIPSGIQGFGGGALPYSSSRPYGESRPTTGASPAGSSVASTGVEPAGGYPTSSRQPALGATPSYSSILDQAPQNPVSDRLNENAGVNQKATSSLEQITALANPVIVAKTGAVGSPVALNTETSGQVVLQNQGTPHENTSAASHRETSLPTTQTITQQTFPSAGLDNGAQPGVGTSAYQPEESAFLLRTLETIRQILLTILRIITPFGGVGSVSVENFE